VGGGGGGGCGKERLTEKLNGTSVNLNQISPSRHSGKIP
jgi:hypothetical protein